MKKKKVIRNNTVGLLLAIHLCLEQGVGLCFVVSQIREIEGCMVAGHHGSLSLPIVVSMIYS